VTTSLQHETSRFFKSILFQKSITPSRSNSSIAFITAGAVRSDKAIIPSLRRSRFELSTPALVCGSFDGRETLELLFSGISIDARGDSTAN
jgi:hypothetical protein